MIRILLAEDNENLRNGIKDLLEDSPDMEITRDAEDSRTLFARLAEEKFDVLLLDISLPDAGWMDILNKLRTAENRIPVIILGTCPEQQYMIRTFKAGVAGYLNKEDSARLLAEAVQTVIDGGRYFSP